MMKIIAHRGLWQKLEDRNGIKAIGEALLEADGVETDVRDFQGKLVVSHDPATSSSVPFEEYLKLPESRNKIWALNIKADGIGERIKKILSEFYIEDYFCFDMSIPETIRYRSFDLKLFSGVSDFLFAPKINDMAEGIWLDSFEKIWYSSEEIEVYLREKKKICIVSEELHQRDHLEQWGMLKCSGLYKSPFIYLCTDKPIEAKGFFYD
ncbi:hypothetical protein [Turicimonas muris]|uniref:hypothetical protein n=1 Tax=Turicimonas muris TaxID=1796652 RepID=UPI002494711D|nr:hypothetical protein [Turicimonas muris]